MNRWSDGRLPAGRWPASRLLAVVAILGAWVVVIAAGAGRAADAETWLNLPSFDWVVYVLLGLMVFVVLLVVIAAIAFRGEAKERAPVKRRSIWPLLILLVVLLALSQREPGEPTPNLADDPIPPAAEAEPAGNSIPDGGPGQGEVLALGLIALAAVGMVLWARRVADDSALTEETPLDVALAPAIHEAAKRLSLGDDPRSSVLSAYGTLEHVLDARGLPRVPTETPTEHIERVLADFGTGSNPELETYSDEAGDRPGLDPDPILKLAGLYEIARFSDRPITEAEQAAAADSLRRFEDRMGTV